MIVGGCICVAANLYRTAFNGLLRAGNRICRVLENVPPLGRGGLASLDQLLEPSRWE